jgi:hypothetical protein
VGSEKASEVSKVSEEFFASVKSLTHTRQPGTSGSALLVPAAVLLFLAGGRMKERGTGPNGT